MPIAPETPDLTRPDLDALTRELTAFESFEDMATDRGRPESDYRPSLPGDRIAAYCVLADAYDAYQAGHGSHKRAYRAG